MFFGSALLSLAAIAAAKEMPKDEILGAKLYDSGIRHANNMALKKVSNDDMYDALHCANVWFRRAGRSRRLRVHTTRRSTARSMQRWNVSVGRPSPAQTSSVAATSISFPSSHMRSLAVSVESVLRHGVRAEDSVANSSRLISHIRLDLRGRSRVRRHRPARRCGLC